jgi:hypothetical protein
MEDLNYRSRGKASYKNKMKRRREILVKKRTKTLLE